MNSYATVDMSTRTLNLLTVFSLGKQSGKIVLRRTLLLSVLTFLSPGSTVAADQAVEPRDIEQVYTRPTTTASWSSMFQKYTGRDEEIKSVAIVIGISDYSKGWKPLEAPWYDALRVRDFLIKSGFDYVVTLTNKSASKDKIQHYMEDVFPDLLTEDDRFVFYFSGHGAQRSIFGSIEGYLPMIDSPKNGWSTMISMNDIEEWNKEIGQTRHSLFVLDSCFSGLAGSESKGYGLSNIYVRDLLKSGHFLMTAGSKGQESYGSLKQWGGSLFTDAFLKGASGAADSGSKEFPPDGVITVTKLYNYIRSRVSAERDQLPQINQTPLLSDLTPKSSGEFFFFASSGQVQFPPLVSAAGSIPAESKGVSSNTELSTAKTDNGAVSPRSVWTDATGRLMWTARDNGQYVDWAEANNYCANMTIADLKGWRLPTIDELKGIHDLSHRYPFTWSEPHCCQVKGGDPGLIFIKDGVKLDSCCAWSSHTENGGTEASYYRFQPNLADKERVKTVDAGMVDLLRALCVRSMPNSKQETAPISEIKNPLSSQKNAGGKADVRGDAPRSPTSFRRAARNNLSSNGVTCLDQPHDRIPAGTRVCVTMHGSWLGPWPGGVAPWDKNHPTTVWTQAFDATSDVISTESRYVHPNEFLEQQDYVVCVRPPSSAQTNTSDRMAIDVRRSAKPCSLPAMP
jgi:hypothetical protein